MGQPGYQYNSPAPNSVRLLMPVTCWSSQPKSAFQSRDFYSSAGPALNFSVALANKACCCASSSASLKPDCSILLCFFSRVCIEAVSTYSVASRSACWPAQTHRLCLLKLRRYFQEIRHIVAEAQLLERLGDVLARYRLLGVLFCNFVCLAADHGDEFDTAFDEQVAAVFGKRHAFIRRRSGRWRQDLADDFLDRRAW